MGGISSHLDNEMNAHMAPSWAWLEDALIASGSVLRCISYFDEMAQLGFQERIESGLNENYEAALRALKPSESGLLVRVHAEWLNCPPPASPSH